MWEGWWELVGWSGRGCVEEQGKRGRGGVGMEVEVWRGKFGLWCIGVGGEGIESRYSVPHAVILCRAQSC